MPKAARECNSLTASRANKPRRDDFSGFPILPRSISGILPIAAIAMARPFKILLYNDFQQNIARFRGSHRHNPPPRSRHSGGLQILLRHAIYSPTAAFHPASPEHQVRLT
ncbi:MAG: hypothetical protein J0I08_07380 [Rhizobiales bacterium]|nr:hypothetical protein [Hyphomicrobiales bacterium]